MHLAEAVAEIGSLLDAGVVIVDADAIVTHWNDWLVRATGIQRADVVGRRLCSCGVALNTTAMVAVDQAIQGSVVVLSHAFHGWFLDARPAAGFDRYERMQQSARLLPLRDEGTAAGAAIFIEDVTERVAREADLRTAVGLARAAEAGKSQFFAGMSHELRTPIGAIAGYADLMEAGMFGPVTEEQRERLRRITGVAQHLEHIVNDILSFARVDAGREEVELVDTDAVVLAQEAIAAVEPLAVQKGLKLASRYAAPVMPMRTDAVKVRQILINLLGNAVKFTAKGSVELEVARTGDGRSLSFSVLDTGPGIAPADLGAIFDPFVRGTPRNASRPGTGLGLAVSRGFARLLGGDVAATSELAIGSRFTATIPA